RKLRGEFRCYLSVLFCTCHAVFLRSGGPVSCRKAAHLPHAQIEKEILTADFLATPTRRARHRHRKRSELDARLRHYGQSVLHEENWPRVAAARLSAGTKCLCAHNHFRTGTSP